MKSRIEGEWTGWDGNTVVTLVNGSVWQQDEYYYRYQYKYRQRSSWTVIECTSTACRRRSGYIGFAKELVLQQPHTEGLICTLVVRASHPIRRHPRAASDRVMVTLSKQEQRAQSLLNAESSLQVAGRSHSRTDHGSSIPGA
jgi:hypothetical protein